MAPKSKDHVRLQKLLNESLPDEVKEFFRQQGAKGGKIGGKRRLEKISDERRTEIAKKAAEARWGKDS